jgi:hypothetical protein
LYACRHRLGVIYETNLLSLISPRLKFFYQIRRKCYSICDPNTPLLAPRAKEKDLRPTNRCAVLLHLWLHLFERTKFLLCIKHIFASFGWLVADGWCWFVVREKYYWLVGGWWLVLNWCERKALLTGWEPASRTRPLFLPNVACMLALYSTLLKFQYSFLLNYKSSWLFYLSIKSSWLFYSSIYIAK